MNYKYKQFNNDKLLDLPVSNSLIDKNSGGSCNNLYPFQSDTFKISPTIHSSSSTSLSSDSVINNRLYILKFFIYIIYKLKLIVF
jgi:hypothetical protein